MRSRTPVSLLSMSWKSLGGERGLTYRGRGDVGQDIRRKIIKIGKIILGAIERGTIEMGIMEWRYYKGEE